MTKYDAGRRFEWQVRDDMILNGYDVVRSAGSKSKIDLCCFKQGQVLLVQAKAHGGPLPPAERSELIRIAALIGATPLHAYKPARGRLAYRELTGQGPGMWQPWTTDQAAP